MDALRPLRAALFIYECFRILLLVVLIFLATLESPHLVYLSANALFPLMALFVWLRPEEYRNYLSLYMTGKIIAAVSFYAWGFLTVREYYGLENFARSLTLFGGSVLISLADILSVGGAWMLKNKYRQAYRESGGV